MEEPSKNTSSNYKFGLNFSDSSSGGDQVGLCICNTTIITIVCLDEHRVRMNTTKNNQ